MSLSAALSLETLPPEELFAMAEKDLGELWTFYGKKIRRDDEGGGEDGRERARETEGEGGRANLLHPFFFSSRFYVLAFLSLPSFLDTNDNGVLELDEFTCLVTDVLQRMAQDLPSSLPRKYCEEFNLNPQTLEGIEARIAEKFKLMSRNTIAKKLFDLMLADGAAAAAAAASSSSGSVSPLAESVSGALLPEDIKSLHALMETHVLKELYESVANMIIEKQMKMYENA